MATARKKTKAANEARAVGAPLKITDQEIQDALMLYREEILSPNARFVQANKIGNPVSFTMPTFERAALRCGLTRNQLYVRCCAKNDDGSPKNEELQYSYKVLKTAISMVWLEAGLCKALNPAMAMFALYANKMYEEGNGTQVHAQIEQSHLKAQQEELDSAYEEILADLRVEKEAMRQRRLAMYDQSGVIDA